MNKISAPYSDQKISIVLYILGILIQWFYFGRYISDPNSMMVGFGGDPYVIYTNMVNHICNGSGVHLDFMNYPYGESIFMTDMQASFSLLFGWINNNVFEICEYIPGLIHGTIMALMPLTVVFLYNIFRKFDTVIWLSIISSIAIAYLSPQIFRFRGQLSLVYPFLVPMSIFWLVDLYDRKKPQFRDFFLGFTLFFFMLNNAYTGLIAAAPLLAGGLSLLILKEWKTAIRPLIAGIIPLVLGYAIIKLTDPFDDRLGLQWGTFHYNIGFQSIFYPKYSFLNDFIEWFTPVKDFSVGKRMNFGLGNILLWSLLAFLGLKSYFTHKNYIRIDKKLLAVAGAGLFSLVYAMNSNLIPGIQDFLETHLKELLMFKASGRLGWVSYFVCGIVGIVLIDRIIKKYKNNRLFTGLTAVILLIWISEAHVYLNTSFNKIFHENHFNLNNIEENLEKIDVSRYEAIYTIPPLQTWNDKIKLPVPWSTQYSALMLSAKSGLPIINAQLSRAPIMSSVGSAAIASSPPLPKERLKILPLQKPILLVKGNKVKTTEGQQYLIDQSKPRGTFLRSSLYEMPASINSKAPVLKDSSDYFIHRSYENSLNASSMIGKGALEVSKGDSTLVFAFDSIPNLMGKDIEVSFWYHINKQTYHNPTSWLYYGNQKSKFSDKSGKDFYKDWRKHSAVVNYNGGAISIKSKCKVNFNIDELHIQSVSDTTHFLHESGIFIYNGYPTQ